MKRTPSRLVAAFLAWALVLGLAGSAYADGPFDTEQATRLQTARGLRNAGIAITMVAVATEVVALGLWIHSIGETCFGESCRGDAQPRDANAVLSGAIATAAIAPVLLGIGIPMWSVGAHREKKLQPGLSFSAAGAVHF